MRSAVQLAAEIYCKMGSGETATVLDSLDRIMADTTPRVEIELEIWAPSALRESEISVRVVFVSRARNCVMHLL